DDQKLVPGVRGWQAARKINDSLLPPPHRTLVLSSHSVGKTHTAAGLVSWFFDTFRPGVCITTAPSDLHGRTVLWNEIRLQRKRAALGGFKNPQAPHLY